MSGGELASASVPGSLLIGGPHRWDMKVSIVVAASANAVALIG